MRQFYFTYKDRIGQTVSGQLKELTQKKAANKLGVDQPQVSRLLARKIDCFTIDKLMVLLFKGRN